MSQLSISGLTISGKAGIVKERCEQFFRISPRLMPRTARNRLIPLVLNLRNLINRITVIPSSGETIIIVRFLLQKEFEPLDQSID